MRVFDCKISSRLQATIKVSWIKTVKIDVLTKHAALGICGNNKALWDIVEHDYEMSSVPVPTKVLENLRSNLDFNNQNFAGTLLAVAGNHPDEDYNIGFKTLLETHNRK